MFKAIGLISFCCLMVRCASTLSKSECELANWNGIGFDYGVAGQKHTDEFKKYRERCREYGIKADYSEFRQGYIKGLARYCTPKSAYNAGIKGKRYLGVCPDELGDEFNQYYEQGRAAYIENKQRVSQQQRSGSTLSVPSQSSY